MLWQKRGWQIVHLLLIQRWQKIRYFIEFDLDVFYTLFNTHFAGTADLFLKFKWALRS